MHRAVGWGSLRPSLRGVGNPRAPFCPFSFAGWAPPGPLDNPRLRLSRGSGPRQVSPGDTPRGSGIRPIRVYVTPGYTPLQGVAVPYRPLRRLRAQCRHWMSLSAVRPELTRTAGQAGPSRAAGSGSVAATVPGTVGLAWLSRFAGGAPRSLGHGPGLAWLSRFAGGAPRSDGRRGGLSVRRELTRADPVGRSPRGSLGPP